MDLETSGSEIVEFYKGKNVLITGATGFLGKLFVEQLLRKCAPKKLYLLIRSKKNIEPKQRLLDMFQLPLFEKLKTEKPDYLNYVETIDGDTSMPDLGLSDDSIHIIKEKIDIVFHGAATVKFNEHIKLATTINVLGTKNLLLLSRQMKNLKAFIHISTAFSNCPNKEIKEEFYETPISADNLIKLTECLKENQLSFITEQVLEQWPNTYSFTKAIAEDAVRTYAKGLPAAVLRPAIITNTRSEPMDGWIDNLYGPVGITMGVGAGLIRVMVADKDRPAEIVPADMTVNAGIAAAYKTYQMGPMNEIPIYNYVPSSENRLTWGHYLEKCMTSGFELPPVRAVWCYSLTLCKSLYVHNFLIFLLHILPALLIDIVLVAINKKPAALKIYSKIHMFTDVLSYFSTRSWKFHYTNVQALQSGLNKKDRELFDFDMSQIKWDPYLASLAKGVRLYLFKDPLETIPQGKRKMFWLRILHRVVQIAFFSLVAWVLWSTYIFASRSRILV